MNHFAEWELLTISALAAEALARLWEKQWVSQPERFVERFEADTQLRLREHPKERSSLVAHARRLEIGPHRTMHPPRLRREVVDVAPREVAARYCGEIIARLRA